MSHCRHILSERNVHYHITMLWPLAIYSYQHPQSHSWKTCLKILRTITISIICCYYWIALFIVTVLIHELFCSRRLEYNTMLTICSKIEQKNWKIFCTEQWEGAGLCKCWALKYHAFCTQSRFEPQTRNWEAQYSERIYLDNILGSNFVIGRDGGRWATDPLILIRRDPNATTKILSEFSIDVV